MSLTPAPRLVLACLTLAALTFSGTAVPVAEPSTTDPITTLLQYGPLGIMVIGFVTGWIAPGPQVKQLLAENSRLNLLITDKMLPIIEKVTLVMDQNTNATTRQTEVFQELRALINDWARELRGERGK